MNRPLAMGIFIILWLFISAPFLLTVVATAIIHPTWTAALMLLLVLYFPVHGLRLMYDDKCCVCSQRHSSPSEDASSDESTSSGETSPHASPSPSCGQASTGGHDD